MSDKLEIFIDNNLKEFDTIEPTKSMWSNIGSRVEAKSVKVLKSKLLSKFIYFSLSVTVIIMTSIYFLAQKQNETPTQTPQEKPKEILKDESVITTVAKDTANEPPYLKVEKKYENSVPVFTTTTESNNVSNITESTIDSQKQNKEQIMRFCGDYFRTDATYGVVQVSVILFQDRLFRLFDGEQIALTPISTYKFSYNDTSGRTLEFIRTIDNEVNKLMITSNQEKFIFNKKVNEKTILSKQDSAKEKPLVDIMGVPRGIFFHISYSGGPLSGRKSQVLFWYTHKEIPNTHFIIEHYIWNKWVKRGKVIPKSRPGRQQYSGEIIGKYSYHLKLPPHSGENKWRVLLMNDSNVCIGVSKELDGVNDKGEPLHLIPKVDYTIKKKTKEIIFSSQTYYELHDVSGKIVDEGMALSFFYGTVEPGVYTLYYDNSIETIKLK